VLKSYARYYNESQIHCSLSKDAPFPRAIERLGVITSQPVLGGLQHQRVAGAKGGRDLERREDPARPSSPSKTRACSMSCGNAPMI
jgi:hypothetical protein